LLKRRGKGAGGSRAGGRGEEGGLTLLREEEKLLIGRGEKWRGKRAIPKQYRKSAAHVVINESGEGGKSGEV